MTKRKDYHKPEVQKVALVVEEAVLTNCKNEVVNGPDVALGRCNAPDGTFACLEPGS